MKLSLSLIFLATLIALAQDAPPVAPVREKPEASKGIPPRTGPADYQAHGQAGKVTIAAEFDDHSFPDPSLGVYNQDFIFVEVAFYGAPGTNLALNYQDFSLRVNGKKNLLPAKPYELTFNHLMSPEYEAPSDKLLDTENNSKTKVDTSGQNNTKTDITTPKLPPIVHIPFDVKRGWEQKIHMASLPEGERPLPQGGVLYFDKSGKTNSAELVYNGPAGKVTIPLK